MLLGNGRYEILEELGRGGMGQVFKAYDHTLKRIIALKMMLTENTAHKKEVVRFLREARTTANLHHPNIVTVYDVGIEDNRPFFTMELIEGSSLEQILEKSSLTIPQIIEIMIKVGQALHYAHTQGVIHRDLKPANIMMDRDMKPKVMDFGIAKLSQVSHRLSKSGTILGTLNYMPPEQAQGRTSEIDNRSDVYALGGVLYEMLTGRPPFKGSSTFNLLYQILKDPPLLPSRIKRRIAKDLELICLKALEKKKARRYPSASEFVEDLIRFRQGEKVKAKKLSVWRYHRAYRRRIFLAFGLFAFFSFIMSVIFLGGKHVAVYEPGPQSPVSQTVSPQPSKQKINQEEKILYTAYLDFDKIVQHNIILSKKKSIGFREYGKVNLLSLYIPAESEIECAFSIPSIQNTCWKLSLEHMTTGDDSEHKASKAGYAPINIFINNRLFKQNYDVASNHGGDWLKLWTDIFDITMYVHKGDNTIKILFGRTATVCYWLRKIEIKNE